jgi:hypothetical protein
MEVKSYGVTRQTELRGDLDRPAEEIAILGYTILPSVVAEPDLKQIRTRLDRVYQTQVDEFGLPALQQMQEEDLARCPLAYDPFFLGMALNPMVLALVRKLLGEHFILHLQNGIINQPGRKHHQTSWHRDLPYQDFVCSVPLAVSALVCLDDFEAETGGTLLLPFSHRLDHLPSAEYLDRHAVVAQAKAGSVLVFNAMTYHRAGVNRSGRVRRGLNHVYTIPLIKQQISIPNVLGSSTSVEARLRPVLGYGSESAESPQAWRHRRLARVR